MLVVSGASGASTNTQAGLISVAAVPPPTFQTAGAISMNASGQPTFMLAATNGIKYRIVYKDDLLTNVWTSLGDWQISPSNGDMELTDTNAMTRTQRFYRIEAHLP